MLTLNEILILMDLPAIPGPQLIIGSTSMDRYYLTPKSAVCRTTNLAVVHTVHVQ